VEALESCQQGFNSGGVEWNDISRAWRVSRTATTSQMRTFWRRWAEQMGPARLVGGVPVTAVSDRVLGWTLVGSRHRDPAGRGGLLYREAGAARQLGPGRWLALWAPGPDAVVVPCNDTPTATRRTTWSDR